MESRLIQLDGDCLEIRRKTGSVPGGRRSAWRPRKGRGAGKAAVRYLGVVGQVDLPGDVVYRAYPLWRTWKETLNPRVPTYWEGRETNKTFTSSFSFLLSAWRIIPLK